MKLKLLRESELELDAEYQRRYQNVGYFFQLPDCFIMIYKPGWSLEEKLFKNIDFPILKAWMEQKATKKQECVMIIQFDVAKIADYNEKKMKKVFERVKSAFSKDQQPKILRYIYNTEPNVDIPQILKADEQMCIKYILQSIVQVVSSNIDEKINFYDSQILYQSMKAKNGLQDYYQYLILVFGKVFLLLRLGKLRVAFEQLQNLGEILQDKSKIFIDYELDQDVKLLLKKNLHEGVQTLTQLKLFDWSYFKIIESLQCQDKGPFLNVFYMHFWLIYSMLRSITMKPQDLLLDIERYISHFLRVVNIYFMGFEDGKELLYPLWLVKFLKLAIPLIVDASGFSLQNLNQKGLVISFIQKHIFALEQIQRISINKNTQNEDDGTQNKRTYQIEAVTTCLGLSEGAPNLQNAQKVQKFLISEYENMAKLIERLNLLFYQCSFYHIFNQKQRCYFKFAK